MSTTQRTHFESLGSRIVRRAAQTRTEPVRPRPSGREHEYVRERAKALAVIRDHVELRAELAAKLGRVEGQVIGFRMLRAAPPADAPRIGVRIGGGGSWPPAVAAHVEPLERPTKRRGRPGRRGKLVAALARSRQL